MIPVVKVVCDDAGHGQVRVDSSRDGDRVHGDAAASAGHRPPGLAAEVQILQPFPVKATCVSVTINDMMNKTNNLFRIGI